MSKITEMVKAEADDAEAAEEEEEPNPEPKPEPEPKPTPEPPVGEKQLQAMDRLQTRYQKDVERIMGADFAAVFPCPECSAGIAGFVFQQPGAEPNFKENPGTQLCTTCDGWGRLLSGSREENNRLMACSQCGATGYVTRAATLAPPTYTGSPPATMANGPSAPLPYRDVHGNECAVPPDLAGRLFGDPLYGMPEIPTGAAA